MVDIQTINYVISQSWAEYESVGFDDETNRFVNDYICEHYNMIRKGLLDYSIDKNTRQKMYEDLKKMICSYSDLILVDELNGCISGDERDVNKYINSIFKLQGCKEVRW